MKKENHLYRGFLQSGDGVITEVLENDGQTIKFRAEFSLSPPLIERLRQQPANIVFSERSRIARLGIRILCEAPLMKHVTDGRAVLTLKASQTIRGYPRMDVLKPLFTQGLPVGRLAYCDPEALLTSEQVYDAVRQSALKLPMATSISGDGSIIIVPHKVVCTLKGALKRDELEQILLRADGRELLNRYQIGESVSAVHIPPGEGVITTCSMYLNDHYVVLESGGRNGIELGAHFPAIILDPIKTRGIRIYLEIFNNSRHPIINPLITAKIYKARAADPEFSKGRYPAEQLNRPYRYEDMRALEKRMDVQPPVSCHYLAKSAAAIPLEANGIQKAQIHPSGPRHSCEMTHAACIVERRNFTPRSRCGQISAISRLHRQKSTQAMDIALKYFPNLVENRDIINLVFEKRIRSLYFFEASHEHGPFLSQRDHDRLMDYHDLGLGVYWTCGLNNRVMVHTLRDGKGYFVVPRKLAAFHKAMLFAFYGSNRPLSAQGADRLGRLMDNLIAFWGAGIGIVTGGGSGVMELVNTFARQRNILSGANFLDITDQSMTTDVDFCQVFQSSCRHSRQKWFEVASFPIFNIGGIGTLEELGITLCNMKLSISERVPVILFDTEGDGAYWRNMKAQIDNMIREHRAPAWMQGNVVITGDPDAVVEAYRNRLQLF